MTVLTFPSNPIEGQVYNAPTGVRYVYDGVKWIVETTTSTSEAVTNSTQDRVAPMFVDGDHEGISFTYDAGTNVLSATVTAVNGDTLVNGDYEVVLDSSGNLTIPGNIIGTANIDIDNRASGNSADINLFAADDITIQARDRTTGSTSEGGDINIFAGDSAEDGDSSGGDVVIYAGDGGAANVDYGGSGGFITIQTGRGGAASTAENGRSAYGGGDLTLRAGDAGSNNGNAARGADGGEVVIEAGDSTGNLSVGGSINLRTGAGGPNAAAGSVIIDIPSSDQGPGGEWIFNGQGNLQLPAGGDIVDSSGNSVLGSLTVITPEDFEVQGVSTLAFAGAGVSVDRIDDITTVTIAGGDNSYTPEDTDNWNEPTINTVQAALDELAARVTALQNYEIDGGNAYTPPQGELLIDGNGA
jgi:hypothetical protein